MTRPPAPRRTRSVTTIASVLLCTSALSCAATGPPSSASTTTTAEPPADGPAWVAEHGRDPVTYACDLLASADLLLVGETHEVAENCAFVAALLAPAYHDAGVRTLATEFVRSALDDRLHAVVTADTWDEDAAIDLFRAGPWPTWGFQEYVDILRAAWAVNDALPPDAEPLRVVGLDDDWSQLEYLQADRRQRFDLTLAREANMIAAAERALAAPGRVLVHVGFAHAAFSGEHRLGARLRRDHGDRIQHLILHHEIRTRDGRSRITTALEALVAGGHGPAVAFDLTASPYGSMTDPSAPFARMPGAERGIGGFFEHYAILAPVDDLHPVTWIPGFIEADRLAEAIAVGERTGWIEAGAVRTVEEANAAFAARLRARAPEAAPATPDAGAPDAEDTPDTPDAPK